MKERPILFNGEMVRALLDGRKAQTRRVVKAAKDRVFDVTLAPCEIAGEINQGREYRFCPYGQPGDRLWVRETFALQTCVEDEAPPHSDGRPILHRSEKDYEGYTPQWVQPHYRATDPAPDLCCERDNCAQCRDNNYGPHWKPSIHMPRWASRITLEITAVRIERLQDISEEDAKAEGAPFELGELERLTLGAKAKYRSGFVRLWESTNGAGSWSANPWVWVVEFEQVRV